MTGMERLGEGREAEVFLRPDGTVLKLMRSGIPEAAARIEREAAALRALEADGPATPTVVETTIVDGRPGLVTTWVDGPNLLDELGRRPLSVVSAARALADAHLAIHDRDAPPELPDLRSVLRDQIGAVPSLPDALRDEALAILDGLSDGTRLCHGDLHLGNLLGSWQHTVVIDWGDASRGDPLADVAYTTLMHRLGEPPPGSPRLISTLAVVGGKALASQYRARYGATRPIDKSLLRQWSIVRAAARLNADVASEQSRLIRFITRHV